MANPGKEPWQKVQEAVLLKHCWPSHNKPGYWPCGDKVTKQGTADEWAQVTCIRCLQFAVSDLGLVTRDSSHPILQQLRKLTHVKG